MDNMKQRRLQELDRSDFEIVKGESDIRGWDVKTANGQKIGEVEELILDAQQKKVRYMVVDLDDDDLDLEDDKKVLIPIGLAELHKDDDDVLLPSVTVEQLRALPAYDASNLDEEAEKRVCTTLGRKEETRNTTVQTGNTAAQSVNKDRHTESTTSHTGDASTPASTQQPAFGTAEHYANFYQHAYFNDENLYRNRDQEMGPQQQNREESEYERGLRLWEMRSNVGIVPGETDQDAGHAQNTSEARRKEMIEARRRSYEERRGVKKDSTIIQRIKDEGLQDAGR